VYLIVLNATENIFILNKIQTDVVKAFQFCKNVISF